jgi:ankyrin repeat protein
MAWYLLPKWHGSAEDPRDFFYQSRDLARPEAGGAMGFVVAWFFADQAEAQNDEFEFRIPWHDLRACYTDFAKVFPDAMEAHNRMALFAIRFHKKTEAAEIFRSAATTHHSGVWSRPAYDAWKAFAVDGAPAPTHSELHEAAAKGDIDGAKKLLSGLDNVDIFDGYGLTPLYYAVKAGHQGVAQALLEAGADAEAVIDGEGHTLLNVAINATDDAMAVLLVDHGADFRVESSPGRPLFHRFFHKGMLDVAEKIVREHDGDVNVRDADGYTALHIVAASGDVDNVRRLLEMGAQIDAQNAIGMTPLLSAVNADHEECASHLVKQGADISLTMNDGLSPLHAAVDHSFKGLVGMFLELGVDVNQKDLDGWTALHMATMNGDKSMLTMLLEAPGADVNIATNEGRTLVHQAAKSGHVDLLRVLVEHGAALNTRNNAGKTALDLALEEEMIAAAEYLESAGAARGT